MARTQHSGGHWARRSPAGRGGPLSYAERGTLFRVLLPSRASPEQNQNPGEAKTVDPVRVQTRTHTMAMVGLPCPACTGPLEGPNSPLEDRDSPYSASFQVKIATVSQNCATLGKSEDSEPEFSPFSSRTRAGRTFPHSQPDARAQAHMLTPVTVPCMPTPMAPNPCS